MQFYRYCRNCLRLVLILLLSVQGAGAARFLTSLGHFQCVTVKCDKVESMLLKWLALKLTFFLNFLEKQVFILPLLLLPPCKQGSCLRIKLACSSLLRGWFRTGIEFLKDWSYFIPKRFFVQSQLTLWNPLPLKHMIYPSFLNLCKVFKESYGRHESIPLPER